MPRLALISFAVLSLVATVATAQIRGRGRLQGNVTDKNSGQPIAGATVSITSAESKTEPIVTKTDSKGHWAAIGMTSGQWNIDISAPGYATSRGSANVSEVATAPPIRIEMQPEAKQQAAVAPTPSVPKEAVDMLKEGQELLKVSVGDVITTQQTTTGGSTAVSHTITPIEVKQNADKAVADFEKALPQIPDTTPQLHEVRSQVMDVLATAYFRSGDVSKAIATLEQLQKIDPPGPTPDTVHLGREIRLANLYLTNGQLAEGRALLDSLPAGAITDPTAYLNAGVLLYNKKNAADAITYFTKAIQLDQKSGDAYYYRALAELQLKKNADAKADLQQVLALAPSSSEASDAKQLLASLK